MSNLDDLKPGDTAILSPTRSEPKIVTVERLTKTQVVLPGGQRFQKSTGRLVGGGTWDSTSLEPATPHLIRRAEIAAKKAAIKTALFNAETEMRSRQQRPGMVLGWAQTAAKLAEEWAALEETDPKGDDQ